jgi:L-ascorbate metabolism protein UlaG (beta-lactamase superfamily)
LGRSCIELIGKQDHIIIDPNFSEFPLKGLKSIFFTHEHNDHINIEKLNIIREKYAIKNNNLQMYGPKSIKNEYNLNIKRIKDGDKLKLNNFKIEAYKIDCYKSKECFGYVITKGDVKLLHSADSSKFSKKLKNFNLQIDYCFVACFESLFNDYLEFLEELRPVITFPYHFDSGEEIKAIKLSKFLNENGIDSKYIEIGTEFEF